MVWRPNSGMQERFIASSAREAGFGGKGGTGKTLALILDMTRHVDDPTFSGLMLRRTKPELIRSGGLIHRAAPIFTALGARSFGRGQYWRFPSGALVELSSLDHETDKMRYDGAEFARIAFDEAHHFTVSQYLYLFSRLRHATIPTRMRFGCNPGAKWIRDRFAPWIYPRSRADFKGPYAEPGDRLWVALVDGEEKIVDRHHFDPFCAACQANATGCELHRPISRTFFKAPTLAPQLVGTGYVTALNQLPFVDRVRMRDGDWFADEGSGKFFRREWWSARWDRDEGGHEGRGNIVREIPHEEVSTWVRYFDLAATEPSVESPDPDWTVGALAGTWDKVVAFEDYVRTRGTPHAVMNLIASTVLSDVARLRPFRGRFNADYTVVIEIDPGQAAKHQRDDYARMFSKLGVSFDFVRPVSGDDKETRAKPASAAAESGLIVMKAGDWLETVLGILQRFPTKGVHDDDVDATSGAYNWLRGRGAHRRPSDEEHVKPRLERPHMHGGF